ncbi:SDR family oxidoreductase [Microtetraspora malaysiensis]|uniref:SDR family oxidoreductase n=1 Tax=Microtetraspora malaysiensis TaxID=161358 RepID=UPI003D8A9B34
MLSVVITGGSSGIGLAVLDALLETGASVCSLDRVPSGRESGRLVEVIGDVTDPEAHTRAVGAALAAYGRLDAFIGNAGVHDGGASLETLSGADLRGLARHLFDVNVIGFLLGAQAAISPLRESRGSMIFTLSDAAFQAAGVGAGACYVASKAAGLGIVRHLAATYAPEIRVNAVAPGGVPTNLHAVQPGGEETRRLSVDPEALADRVRAINPLGVALRPHEIAEYYLFLLSGAGRAMTGQVLRPDGGLSVRS